MQEIAILGSVYDVGPFSVVGLSAPSLPSIDAKLPPMIGVTFNELPTPRVNQIHAFNDSDDDIFVPAGWILDGLLQTRMVTREVLIPAGSDAEISVACVEAGRWGDVREVNESGRAPLSVLLAAGSIGPKSENATLENAQTRVWSEVRNHETRSGVRSTGSLSQIMHEDAANVSQIRSTTAGLDQLILHPASNGFMVTLNGQVLMAELYPQSLGIGEVAKRTIAGLAFDSFQIEQTNSNGASLDAFLEQLQKSLNFGAEIGAETATVLQSTEGLLSNSYFHSGVLYSALFLNANHELMKGSIYV